MADITSVAEAFFDACETGQGWNGCSAYCTPDATFSAQAEPLADVTTLEGYCDWMRGLLTFVPDGKYDLKSFATDTERASVSAYAVFQGDRCLATADCISVYFDRRSRSSTTPPPEVRQAMEAELRGTAGS